jgi:hypothetical protein
MIDSKGHVFGCSWLSSLSETQPGVPVAVCPRMRSPIAGSEEVRREILRCKEKAAASAAAFYTKSKFDLRQL